MDRKQEQNYQDPFDLLRNMNDVLYNYGEATSQEQSAEKPLKSNNDYTSKT